MQQLVYMGVDWFYEVDIRIMNPFASDVASVPHWNTWFYLAYWVLVPFYSNLRNLLCEPNTVVPHGNPTFSPR